MFVFIDWLHVFDWLDSLIGPSGLLLVVSHLLAVPVQSEFFMGWVRKLGLCNIEVVTLSPPL
jgi:hypothetical protein